LLDIIDAKNLGLHCNYFLIWFVYYQVE
jgi:hypothetical protein